jgi:hypothetical protein
MALILALTMSRNRVKIPIASLLGQWLLLTEEKQETCQSAAIAGKDPKTAG